MSQKQGKKTPLKYILKKTDREDLYSFSSFCFKKPPIYAINGINALMNSPEILHENKIIQTNYKKENSPFIKNKQNTS